METILVGDFNIDETWQSDFKKHRLVNALTDTKFVQLVSSVTRPVSNSCLDHIWSNKPERITNTKTPDICISDHLPVLGVGFYKHCSANNKKHQYLTYRNIKHLDAAKFLQTLETPWDSAFVFDESWYCLVKEPSHPVCFARLCFCYHSGIIRLAAISAH